MSKTKDAIPELIVEQDGPLSWLVTSESEPGIVHGVSFFKGPGGKATYFCSCKDYQCRHAPRLRSGVSMRDAACKHLKAVTDHLRWQLVERMVEMFNEGESD